MVTPYETEENQPDEVSVNKESKEKKTKQYCLQKYNGAEAILVNHEPLFLQIINGNAVLSDKIIFTDLILNPPDRLSYLNKEYSFESEEEINNYIKRASNENLDSLYQEVKSIWKKYIDAEDFHISISAADTIFTYFQDKLGMTHYLLFVGDNDTGKSNNQTVFQYLAYRPLFDTSITPANIYQFLGSIEEGQGIILEDEIDNIDQLQEKMKIYKVGYKSGVKVSRMDTSVGRSQQSYWTYGFKAFTAEQQPDSLKGKGFNERVFVIKCSPGNPDYDIIEIINNAGDEKYKLLFNELLDIRKLLLIYRLLHHNDPIPDIALNIKNRDKQLCKPLIRLFQGTNSINDILASLSKLLMEKKERKGNTLEARLYHIINDFINKNNGSLLDIDDKVTLESARIWNIVKEELEGEEIPGKPRSYDTGEYGIISSTKVVCILEDRFGADKKRNEKIRTLTFSRNKLEN